MNQSPYAEYRLDGWPLCPVCGEDELWSGFAWDGSDPKPPMQAWIDHGLRCYRCGWDSTEPPAITSSSREFQAMIEEGHRRLLEFCGLTKPPPPPTIRTRYGVDYCTLCNFPVDYCGCGTTPAAESAAQDDESSDLNRRIRAVKGG